MYDEQRKEYKIFFVMDEKARVVFVGKSAANDLQPILRKFVYQETEDAVRAFGKLAQPELVLIERLAFFCTRGEAEVHLKVWCEYFEARGYTVHRSMRYELLRRLTDFDIDRIRHQIFGHTEYAALYGDDTKRHICRKREKEKRSPAQKHTANASRYSVLIRTSSAVVERFRAFCKSTGVTQNDGFAMLLEQADGDATGLAYRDLLSRLRCAEEKISELNAEIVHLKSGEDAQRRKQRNERFRAINQGHRELVREYLHYAPMPRLEGGEKLFRYKFEIFRKHFGTMWDEYAYPEETGTEVIILRKFVYGRTDGIAFILGRNTQGDQIKLRYYLHRDNYCGVPIWSGEYVREGTPWLVGWTKAADGAADLIGAFPLSTAWVVEDAEPFDGKLANALERAKKDNGSESSYYLFGEKRSDIQSFWISKHCPKPCFRENRVRAFQGVSPL